MEETFLRITFQGNNYMNTKHLYFFCIKQHFRPGSSVSELFLARELCFKPPRVPHSTIESRHDENKTVDRHDTTEDEDSVVEELESIRVSQVNVTYNYSFVEIAFLMHKMLQLATKRKTSNKQKEFKKLERAEHLSLGEETHNIKI